VDAAPIHSALGDVLFREGKLSEAEGEWLKAINSDESDARAHLGLARISAASSQYAQAKREIDKAHGLDSADPDIRDYFDVLTARPNGKAYDCQLTTNLSPVEIDLLPLSGDRPNQARGYGLPIAINGQNAKLLVDTGAHGIEKATLTKVSDIKLGGCQRNWARFCARMCPTWESRN